MRKTTPSARRAGKRLWCWALLALAALFTSTASADVTEVWRLEDGAPLTVEYRDDAALRLSWNGQVLLFREGRGYWVRWLDGIWQVVDLEDAQQGPLGPMLQSLLTEAGPLGPVAFRLTGATGPQERVAGIAGTTYYASARLPEGTIVSETVVLAADPELQQVQIALVQQLRRYGSLLGAGPFDLPPELEREGGLALLRYGKAIRLERLSRAPIHPARFELPAPPMPARLPWPVMPPARLPWPVMPQ
ncbi:MAG TPA: hypothetical protein PKE41_05645 [Candidatus Macondimonas sp.]|nr:hypothetical protein [Candidatus Macondimonas sp.]